MMTLPWPVHNANPAHVFVITLHYVTARSAWRYSVGRWVVSRYNRKRVLWTREADWKYNCFNLLTRNILTLTEFLGKIKQLANFLVKLVELFSYWAQKSDSKTEKDEWLGGLLLIRRKGTFFIILWKYLIHNFAETSWSRWVFICMH